MRIGWYLLSPVGVSAECSGYLCRSRTMEKKGINSLSGTDTGKSSVSLTSVPFAGGRACHRSSGGRRTPADGLMSKWLAPSHRDLRFSVGNSSQAM